MSLHNCFNSLHCDSITTRYPYGYKHNKSITTQLRYYHTPIHIVIYKHFQCYSHKYTFTGY